LYAYLAEVIAGLEESYVEFTKAGFLSTAEGDWATVHAKEVYNVDRQAATYAKPTVTLKNNGGGVFPSLGNGGLTVKCSATNKTYHTTDNPGTLGPNVTLTFQLEADEAGAASSVGDDEIDAIVTTLLGVEIVSSTGAAAQDEQSVGELQDQCGDTLGALSPNGPPDAYEYVCKNPALTGNTEINRATSVGDHDSGEVTVYVASATGSVTPASVAAAQAACLKWATPLTVLPTVYSAAANPVAITAQISGSDIPASFRAAILGELGALFIALPIGGTVHRSRIIAAIHDAVPQIASVNLISPAIDVVMPANNVPTLGTINLTEI
jgi:hypothetical protein